MHEPVSILSIVFKSIFIGFGFTVPLVSLIKTSNLKAVEFKQLFILCAVQALRLAGICYFMLVAYNGYLQYKAMSGISNETVSFTFPAKFWLYYFYSPLLYLVISQLFWIKKLYHRKISLIVLSLLLLLLPSQILITYVTAVKRDYIPSSSAILSGTSILEFVLNQIVFIFIVITIIFATGKLKTKKE